MPLRIGLISPHSDIWAMGLRQISACLKAAGHEPRLIFLPEPGERFYLPRPHPQAYPPAVVDQVCDLCADVDLVGIGLMSNFVGRARSLTEAIHHRIDVPVIWGGIHPTVRPEECLQWADFVCIGEGEQAIVEFVDCMASGKDHRNVQNIWLKDIANPVRPLNTALDALPFPDYDLSSQYLLTEGRLVTLTPPLLAEYATYNFSGKTRISYMTYMTRGCPYACTYCCSNALSQIYPDSRRIRQRSPERVIAEIEFARQVIPDLQGIVFSDEVLLAVKTEELRRFGELYRQRVGLPFITSTTPGTITEEKLKCLIEAGLQDLRVGIQTGSPRIRELFGRSEDDRLILTIAQRLNRFQKWIPAPRYDVITDNPYDMEADKLATLRLAYQLPRPYRLQYFSLTFFPGTDLYRRAKVDGFIQDDERDIYQKNFGQMAPTYYNFVLLCFHYNLPRGLLRLLIQPLVFRACESTVMRGPVRAVWKIIDWLRVGRSRRKHLTGRAEPEAISSGD